MEISPTFEETQSEADMALAERIRLVEQQYGSLTAFFDHLHPEAKSTRRDQEFEEIRSVLKELAKREIK